MDDLEDPRKSIWEPLGSLDHTLRATHIHLSYQIERILTAQSEFEFLFVFFLLSNAAYFHYNLDK